MFTRCKNETSDEDKIGCLSLKIVGHRELNCTGQLLPLHGIYSKSIVASPSPFCLTFLPSPLLTPHGVGYVFQGFLLIREKMPWLWCIHHCLGTKSSQSSMFHVISQFEFWSLQIYTFFDIYRLAWMSFGQREKKKRSTKGWDI